jgi:hypothetical protein
MIAPFNRRLSVPARASKVLILWLTAFSAFAITSGAPTKGGPSAKQIRKLITRVAGIALPSGAVRIKGTSPVDSSTIEATADIETAFRLEQNDKGQWRVAEFRTGPGQWEEIELIARAVKTEVVAGACDNPDLTAFKQAETYASVKRARCLIANLLGVQLPSDAVRIKEVSPMVVPLSSRPSALVVATVEADFRLSKSQQNAWRVAGVRTGNREWADPDAILNAVNADKAARARAELDLIAKALEAFRRERGFYVESNTEAVLIDHLSPRYLSRVIRIDPWLRPYRYEGTRDHFTLRSAGLDGKENTNDDIVLNGPPSSTATQTSPN